MVPVGFSDPDPDTAVVVAESTIYVPKIAHKGKTEFNPGMGGGGG